MGKVFNKKQQKNIRISLRKQDVGAERLLWQKLRNRNYGHKFRRQHGIGDYVVDFYCAKLRLAIEIDGSTHESEEQIILDKEKEDYIKSVGVTIKRYLNSEVYENQDLVVDNILEICNGLEKNQPHPSPLLKKERG